MRVAIIGGGAVGLLFGYYFSKSVEDTVVYVRRNEQAQLLNRAGLKLYQEGTLREVKVQAKVLEEEDQIIADLVIVAVKQYDLNKLSEVLCRRLARTTKLLFIQNGMGHIAFLETLPQTCIYVGMVNHGALKIAEHKVEHSGKGIMKLAAFRGKLEAVSPMLENLDSTRFPIEFSNDWYSMLAEKLLVNAVINPLTALYHIENGALIRNDYFLENMQNLFDEAFESLGLSDKPQKWEYVVNICRQTATNRSSMLTDIESGRSTEIDAICGYLLERGESANIPMPYTRFVYNGIKGMSV
ncbi:MAG TPA: 2-dehydropantoate 2-reductase [Bacillales bacterium]|nr:2-dehydropantoate 2-reductase [Bacillales bacterium]